MRATTMCQELVQAVPLTHGAADSESAGSAFTLGHDEGVGGEILLTQLGNRELKRARSVVQYYCVTVVQVGTSPHAGGATSHGGGGWRSSKANVELISQTTLFRYPIGHPGAYARSSAGVPALALSVRGRAAADARLARLAILNAKP